MAYGTRKTAAAKTQASAVSSISPPAGRGRQTVYAVPTLGPAIKAARERAGMSQRDVAKKLGLSSASVAQWECVGENYVAPMIDNLWGISRLLDVPISELLGESTPPAAPKQTAHVLQAQNQREVSLLALFRALPGNAQDEFVGKLYEALGVGKFSP
jgi:transcriptional regulator with XRE-family HTH domain